LLNQSPHRRAADANFFGDFRTAHHDSSMIREQADDAPQAGIGARRSPIRRAEFGFCFDAGIIAGDNIRCLPPKRSACFKGSAGKAGLQAGTTLMLISAATEE
jgi:hypothetical protein